MNKTIIWIVGIVVVAAAILLIINAASQTSDNGTPPPPPVVPPPPAAGGPPPSPVPPPQIQTVISMTAAGFTPKTITIKKDTTVTFKNDDTRDRWPASAIHPTHEIYPEFDPKRAISAGESWSFTFERVGVWRYHDHLFPSITGTITVEE